ncbi:hypothetical protein ACLOJK_014338 [Asimina triloba]
MASRGAHEVVSSAMEGAKEKDTGKEKEAVESASDGYEYLDSDDDEVDYSVKPEFYDPDLDDKDELWVHKKRKGCISDAILSCPACFTTLCLDCQRHEKYVTQFRAMFVVNCNVMKNQVLRERKVSKPKRTNRPTDSKEDLEKGAVFRPVCCSVCSTEVGIFDEGELTTYSATAQQAFVGRKTFFLAHGEVF